MAGQVRILKEGEILFRTGDQAQTMYIVRRGTLKVYFLKGNEEVQLALLNDGAIVGEMAFFDQKPRSAHVRALTQTEVTEITRADFDRLLTQIPKWLVTMMQSLSGRLRAMNEKLATLEKSQGGAPLTANGGDPFVPIVRSLRIIQLLLNHIGQKDGTTFILDEQSTLEWWMSLTGWSRDYFLRFIAVLAKQGLINRKSDDGRAPRLIISSRARLQMFTDFVVGLQARVSSTSIKAFGPQWIALFEAALSEAVASGYEAYNVPISSLPMSHAGLPAEIKDRLQIAEELAQWLQLRVTKSSQEVLVRIAHKEHKNTVALLKMLQAFLAAELDRNN